MTSPSRSDTYIPKNRAAVASQGRRKGFSLVEVLIAIGITSFAVISTIGVIPVGLQSMRESVFVSAQAAITESLVAEAQRTSWDQLDSLNNAKHYFSEDGRPAKEESSAAFDVTTVLQKSIPSSPTGLPHQQLASLTIEIRATAGGRKAKFSALVGNNGSLN